MKRIWFLLLLIGLCSVACLGEWGLEEHEFPCRKPSDCIEGFFCHPISYVCVPVGTSTRTPVSSTPDAGE